MNASRRHCATSVTPGAGSHGTQCGVLPQGSGELSHFCAVVPVIGLSYQFAGQSGLMIA
ncbi:MAG TPA: hypothetical protein VHI71_06035 [Actinomycetota bacterium]|nr:hypothetical protein [Actinomycetota bacterium]